MNRVESSKVLFNAHGYEAAARNQAELAPDILRTFNFTDDDRCWFQLFHRGDRTETPGELDELLWQIVPDEFAPEWRPADWWPPA